MRRRLTLTVLAVTAMVTIAFLLPLAAAIRIVASDRAISVADQEARSLDGVLATDTTPGGVQSFVDQLNADHSGRMASVYLPSGQRLGPDLRPPASELALARRGRAFTAKSNGHDRVWVAVRLPSGVAVGVISVPTHLLTQGVGEAWLALVGVAIFVVLLAMALADRLGRSMVRPIVDLGAATRRLRSGDLDTRVVPAGPPEIADVGQAVNDLADRIIELLALEREAAADLSHSLRTPLAALQLEADGLRYASDRKRMSAAVRDLTDAVNAVIVEVRQGRPARSRAVADLATIVDERLAFWSLLADEQGRPWSVDLPPLSDDSTGVASPPGEVAAAVDALIGNVLAHTPEDAAFRVAVHPGAQPTLIVEDDGPGLGSPRVTARGTSGAGSTGLGLDIARRTAERSGGQLLTGSSPSGGARIEVHFGPPRPERDDEDDQAPGPADAGP